MNTNILERFGLKSVGITKLHNSVTDKVALKIPQANSIELSVTSDSVEAKENGMTAITWSKTKEATLKLSTETISFAQMAMNLGSKYGLVLNTSSSNYDSSETFTVKTDGTLEVVLESAPVVGTALSAHLLTSDGELAKELTATLTGSETKTYTIADADLEVGSKVEVNYIRALEAGKCYEFKVGAKSDGKPYRLTSEVICTFKDGVLGMGLLNIPRVKANENFTLTLSAEDPSKFDMEFKVLADLNKKDENGNPEFFSMQILNDED